MSSGSSAQEVLPPRPAGTVAAPRTNGQNGRGRQNGRPNPAGFGTFGGVFTPSILTILGVIMYLRFGWVVGNAGVLGAMVIVTISTLITLLTGLSISQIASDQRVRTGGAYYMISRALGPEVGGSVGVPLFLAQAMSVALYTLGFAESLAIAFPELDQRTLALLTTGAVALIATASARIAIRAQYFIMGAIALSLVSFFLGGPVEESGAPAFEEVGFWHVFAVFFPAVTGIMAGVNMSGDLRDPRHSIPRGTLAAITVSYAVYLAIPILLDRWASPEALVDRPFIMEEMARVGPAILVGVLGATLSSAIGSMLGAPRILQALARDGILPGRLRSLGRGSGAGDEPRVGTVCTLAIAIVAAASGDLNIVAPILTMFFLTTYAMVNVASAVERFLDTPSFRPTFRVHWSLSALGALGCVVVMLLINALATALAVFFALAVYAWLESRTLRSTWGDARQGIWAAVVRRGVLSLKASTHARNWRPQMLVLAGNPAARWHLTEFANSVNHGHGLLTIAAVLPEMSVTAERKIRLSETIRERLERSGVEALVRVISAPSPYVGASVLVEAYGLGRLQPNTIVLGNSEVEEARGEYAEMVERVFEARRNLVIIRAEEERGFGEHRRIDVWWQGLRGNGGLMITLAHLLATSPEWRHSELLVRRIVRDDEAAAQASANIDALFRSTRIRARSEVIVGTADPVSLITEMSRDADLTILGIRPPDGTFGFGSVFERLIEQTSQIPAAAYVLAAEDVAFEEILR